MFCSASRDRKLSRDVFGLSIILTVFICICLFYITIKNKNYAVTNFFLVILKT